jgi:hypothetical protein
MHGRGVGHLLAQALLHGAADEFHRRGHVEGLGQVLEGAALEGATALSRSENAGHDDHRQPRVALLDLASRSMPLPPGHADVADQHLGRVVVQGLDDVARAGKGAHG